MSDIKIFIEELNLPILFKRVDENKFIGEMYDSNTFSKIYSLLENSDLVYLIDSSVLMNENISQLSYENDDYIIKLNGNYKDDTYTCIIKKK